MSHMLNLNKVGAVINQLKSNALNTFSTGIQQQQFSKACEQTKTKSNRFYKGEPVTNLPQLSHFKIYGLGIYLFFSFIKHLTILFGVLALLSIVPMVVNVVYGSNYKHSYNSLNIILTKTSLGSHKYSLLPDDQQSHKLSNMCKIVNVSFDVVACMLFLAFCMYWQERSKSICRKIQHQTKLQSSFTVEVTEFPNDANECDIEQFMMQFGRVTEVVAVRDKTQIIDTAKDINQSELMIKQLQAQIAQEQNHTKYERIRQLQKHVCELYEKLQMSQTKIKRINKFYVQYETMQQRNRVVRKFAKYQKFYHPLLYTYFKNYVNKPQELLLHNSCVWVQPCQTQPTSIIWQTSHITWRKRVVFTVLQIVSTFFVVNGSLVLVSYLSVLVPATQSNLSANGYSYDQISAMYAHDPNSKIVEAWCIQNYQITGSFSQYASTCAKFWNLLTTQTIVGFLISILVMVLKRVIQSITNTLSQYQKYPTLSQKSITNMTKLYQMQFLSSNIMSFLAQANLFGLSVIFLIKNIVPLPSSNAQNNQKSQQQYNDLTSNWYKDVGFQLWLNILILCFLPHVYMPIQYFIVEKVSEWRARKEKLYKKAVEKLQPQQFEIETESANILLIVSTGFVFGGGIQAMMGVVLVCLLVRYYYLRYMFIRFCRVPPIYNESLNSRYLTILKLVLVLRCFMSLYMYTADDVFVPSQDNKLMAWVQSMGVDVHAPNNAVLAKLLTTWYYSIFVLFIFLALGFHSLVVKLLSKYKENKRTASDQGKNNEQVQPQSAMGINNLVAGSNNNDAQNANTDNNANNNHQAQTHHQIFSFSQSNGGEQTKQQRVAIKSYRFEDNPMYADVQSTIKLGTTKQIRTKTNTVSVHEIKSSQEQHNTNANTNVNALANQAFTRIKGKLASQIKNKVVDRIPKIEINQFFA